MLGQGVRQEIFSFYQSGDVVSCKRLLEQHIDDIDDDVQMLLVLAAIHAASQDLESVVHVCRRVLELDPTNQSANFNGAVSLQALGRDGEALQMLRKLISSGQSNQSVSGVYARSLIRAGEHGFADELRQYLKSIGADTQSMAVIAAVCREEGEASLFIDITEEADDTIGGRVMKIERIRCHLQVGETDAAESELAPLLSANPDDAEIILLASRIYRQNDLRKATRFLREKIGMREDRALVRELASLSVQGAAYGEAIELLTGLLERDSDDAESCHLLGDAYAAMEATDDAIRCYERSYALTQNIATAYNLSLMYAQQDDIPRALETLRRQMGPQLSDVILQQYVYLLSRSAVEQIDDRDIELLLRIRGRRVNLSRLGRILLEYSVASIDIIGALYRDRRPQDDIGLAELIAALRSPSMVLMMNETLVCDYDMEVVLREIRSRLLSARQDALVNCQDVLISFATQCRLNTYVYRVTDEESVQLSELTQRFRQTEDATMRGMIVLQLCMFMPFIDLVDNDVLVAADLPVGTPESDRLKKLLLDDVLEERDIRRDLAGSELSDETSRTVQKMYEENPYPRWSRVDVRPARSIDQIVTSVSPHWPTGMLPDAPDVLIAGCGTGSHAIQNALRMQSRSIVAIDLSRASLAYAMRKTTEYDIERIEYRHMDILDTESLEQRFDVIESVGVIHHMNDPAEGLHALVACMKEEGVICLGLYSTLARQNIARLRSAIDVRLEDIDIDDIRRIRTDLMAGRIDGVDAENISGFNDFYSIDECRDLICHVQERTYTIDEIRTLISEEGLEFIGFEFPDTAVRARFQERFPEEGALYDLDRWQQFEEQDTDAFAEMYVFWCRKRPADRASD